MSAEIPFPGAGDPAIGLIETLAWTSDGGYVLLAEHLARLERSARVNGYAGSRHDLEHRLGEAAATFSEPRCRVRLVLHPDGHADITASGLPADTPTSCRVALAPRRHKADDPWLRHKTTRRDRYEAPLAEAVTTLGADEILFLNERHEICEGARTNVFVARDGQLLTPPLSSGLLPGTLRDHLLRSGRAREAVLHIRDVDHEATWFLGNSVRGLLRACWVN